VTVPTSAAELKIFLLAPAPKTSSATMTFFYQVYGNRKEPEPLFVILAPAPGGNLITVPRLQLRNTVQHPIIIISCFRWPAACSASPPAAPPVSGFSAKQACYQAIVSAAPRPKIWN